MSKPAPLDPFSLSGFDYDLPEEAIAQRPEPSRESSRLLVLDRASGKISHQKFSDIVHHLRPGDRLIVNDTRVRPARLEGKKLPSGGRVSVLLLKKGKQPGFREVLIKGRPATGQTLRFEKGIEARVHAHSGKGRYILAFEPSASLDSALDRIGLSPLPPYIRRDPDPQDRIQYQTVFAKHAGSLAAPTAGLHFTKELINRVRDTGAEVHPVTLHVGTGTFLPVRVKDIRNHRMEAEAFHVSIETLRALHDARKKGGRIFAVGTTATRVLESLPNTLSLKKPLEGNTDLFIRPGFRFRRVDHLITNFHLPKSTLLMLVSAFAGRDNIMKAYQEAIGKGYRFLSYGDAMLIV